MQGALSVRVKQPEHPADSSARFNNEIEILMVVKMPVRCLLGCAACCLVGGLEHSKAHLRLIMFGTVPSLPLMSSCFDTSVQGQLYVCCFKYVSVVFAVTEKLYMDF